MLSTIFSEIASGLTSFIPAFFGALLMGFQVLFMNATTTEGVTTYSGLSPVGQVAIVYIVIGICYKITPKVVSWLKLTYSNYKERKAASAKVKGRA